MCFFVYLLLFFLGGIFHNSGGKEIYGEKHIVIVIPSYNNARWYENNLKSVLFQNYSNYHVVYTDDCSTDGTFDLVKEYVEANNMQDRITLIKNENRCKALKNLVNMIYRCEDDTIVVTVDGDDWLANYDVLSHINKVYADPNIWITYGQYAEFKGSKKYIQGFNQEVPEEVVKKNLYRIHHDAFSHLRTFYAGLFKKIQIEDLMYEGEFFAMTWDLAIMIPMMEMAGDRYKFISEILYIYNGVNDINDHKVSKKLQSELDLVIRSKEPYKPINGSFGKVY